MNDIHATGHEIADASIDSTEVGDEGAADSAPVDEHDAAPLETSIVDRAANDVAGDAAIDVRTEPDATDACRANPVGAKGMVTPIDGATFTMGAPAGSDPNLTSARPQHGATVLAFDLNTTEVTVAQFRAFVGDYDCWRADYHPQTDEGPIQHATGYGWKSAWTAQLPKSAAALVMGVTTCGTGAVTTWHDLPDPTTDGLPINCVTWYEALAFCLWQGGRLPAEAEWEFAAAYGTNQWAYPASPMGEPLIGTANFGSIAPGPIDVTKSEKTKEGFGTHDLQGNVAEWVFDAMRTYPSAPCTGTTCVAMPGDDMSGPSDRVYRGGSWRDPPFQSYRRTFAAPGLRSDAIGVRCAFDPPPDR